MPETLAIMTSPRPAADTARAASASAVEPASPILRLTQRLAAGEEQAFREFHAGYFHRLFRYLIVLTQGQEDQAQEALQETFIRAARYVRPFGDEAVFWCWLTALARSALRDGGRKRRRYRALLENYALRFLCLLAGPVAEESDSRLQEQLDRCLLELDPEERGLLRAKYCEGASVKDLAERTGLTEKAIESRLFRLRRQLRARLLEKLGEKRP